MITEEAERALSVVPYFAALDKSLLQTVARSAVRKEYDANQVVFVEGEECPGLQVVQSGWLKAVKTSAQGREQVIRTIGPGEYFNELAIFADAKNVATVIALEPSIVWVVRCMTMHHLLDDHPHFARIVAESLAQQSLHLLNLVEDLSLRSVESRLARTLLERSVDGILHRRPWGTQAEMASALGTVPDVLNRALRSLVEEDLIEVHRQQITILNPQALERKAQLNN